MSSYNPNFSDTQVKGFYYIMKDLSEQIFFDLTDSVTKKSIQVNSVEEAFQAIISFSTSPEELLNRKKINRNLLMQYAFKEKLSIPASAEKKEIASKILAHWNKVHLNTYVAAQPHAETVSYDQPEHEVNPVFYNQTEAAPIGDLATFGQTFTSWFYKMLNSHNQQMNPYVPLDFGPQHFWPDSTLQVNLSNESAIGAEKTAEKLIHFVREGLYFNANLAEGVSTKSESHGLICVIVHGTLHRGQHCHGIFEQAFTLLQDPSTGNNWKIKNVWLNITTTPKTNELRTLKLPF